MSATHISIGIFVGGKSSRMGGKPKGLLPAPEGDGALVERLARVCEEAVPNCPIFLIGEAAPYRALSLPEIPDSPPLVGPMGGLHALLEQGQRDGQQVVAIACDLPFVSAERVRILCTDEPEAAVLAPFIDGVWQPLFARYDARRVLPVVDRLLQQKRHSLRAIFDALGPEVRALRVSKQQESELADWDTPADVERRR